MPALERAMAERERYLEIEVKCAALQAVSKALYELGCYEISLGDTIGIGDPGSTIRMLNEVIKVVPVEKLAGHFHDTYGMSIANIMVALEKGISNLLIKKFK